MSRISKSENKKEELGWTHKYSGFISIKQLICYYKKTCWIFDLRNLSEVSYEMFVCFGSHFVALAS